MASTKVQANNTKKDSTSSGSQKGAAEESPILTIKVLANGEAVFTWAGDDNQQSQNVEYCLTGLNGKEVKRGNMKHDIDKLLSNTDGANKVSFSLTKKKNN